MRIKRPLLSILCILSFLKVTAQNNEEKLRNIVPPSPQAFEMVKYGNMPLNEYQGMAQISIPIAEITEKSISSNIQLNYTKVGVKVDDLPNNAGMNWLLQMGGVITRTVYDRPDESEVTRVLFDNYADMNDISAAEDGTDKALLLNSYHVDMTYDNEIDIFEFSVDGLSGKFYLDRNMNPVLLTKTNLSKIETIGVFKITHQFVITSIDGTKYYFGGDDAIENTFQRDSMYYSDNITSFYLTKIKSIDNSIINFSYNHLGPRAYVIGRNEVLEVMYSISNCVGGGASNSAFNTPYSYNNNVIRVKNAISLTSIESLNQFISLKYDHVASAVGDKITSIEITDKINNKKTKKISFIYDEQYSRYNNEIQRYFLKNVNFYDFDKSGNEMFNNNYSFNYDDPTELPDRNSYSVDAFGYYNGKNNSTFLPDLKLLYNIDTSKYTSYAYSDRRSVFDYAKKGTLTSIKYPTKGTTYFEYEGLDHIAQIVDGTSLRVYSSNYSSELIKTEILDGNKISDDVLHVKFDISQSEMNSDALFVKLLNVNFTIFNDATNEIIHSEVISLSKPLLEELEDGSRFKSNDFIYNTKKDIKYRIVLSLESVDKVNYAGELNLSYNKFEIQKNILGIRLKRTFDIATDNIVQNIKRLYYTSYKDINKESSSFVNYPTGYLSNKYDLDWCFTTQTHGMEPFPMGKLIVEQVILSSVPKGTLSYDNFQKPFLYPNVTISYGGDNFEKGGEEKKFISDFKYNTVILRALEGLFFERIYFGQNSSDLLNDAIQNSQRSFLFDGVNGKPLESKSFKKRNDQLYIQSKTIYSYNQAIEEKIFNIMVYPVFRLLDIPPGYTLSNITSNLLVTYSPLPAYNVSLINKTETQYFDDVPADIDDDSSYNKLTTTTEYFYNNPNHNQVTTQKVTFPDLSYQTTNYSYAHEKGNTYLIDKNMIGIPLTVETLKNGKVISKTETVYPSDSFDANNTTANLPNPKYVTALNMVTGAMSTEVTYDRYDSNGNLLQYTTKSGLPVVIVWGYNNTKPIAKIEGATYPQLAMKTTDVRQDLIDVIVQASNDDATQSTNNDETDLLTTLDNFRKDPTMVDHQITTYTYDPLVGVRSITPPSGMRQVYIYDNANRLKEVREQSQTGNILKENQYHYKP